MTELVSDLPPTSHIGSSFGHQGFPDPSAERTVGLQEEPSRSHLRGGSWFSDTFPSIGRVLLLPACLSLGILQFPVVNISVALSNVVGYLASCMYVHHINTYRPQRLEKDIESRKPDL